MTMLEYVKLILEKVSFDKKLFEKELKSKTILMGFGLDSDAIHSPNEHFGVFNYLKGIETIPLFYKYFVEMSK